MLGELRSGKLGDADGRAVPRAGGGGIVLIAALFAPGCFPLETFGEILGRESRGLEVPKGRAIPSMLRLNPVSSSMLVRLDRCESAIFYGK